MGLIIKNGIRYFGDNSVELTQAQYDALSQAEKLNGTTYYITDGQNITTASAVSYNNTASGLTATDVQGAIDEINATTSPLFYLGSYTYAAASVAANRSITISKNNFGITDIDGYTPISMPRIGVSKAGFVLTTFNATGVNTVLGVMNNTSDAIENTTFKIDIIYVKSNFVQNLS